MSQDQTTLCPITLNVVERLLQGDAIFHLPRELSMLRTLAEQMTEFVQFVADHAYDPAALAKEAKRHGAR